MSLSDALGKDSLEVNNLIDLWNYQFGELLDVDKTFGENYDIFVELTSQRLRDLYFFDDETERIFAVVKDKVAQLGESVNNVSVDVPTISSYTFRTTFDELYKSNAQNYKNIYRKLFGKLPQKFENSRAASFNKWASGSSIFKQLYEKENVDIAALLLKQLDGKTDIIDNLNNGLVRNEINTIVQSDKFENYEKVAKIQQHASNKIKSIKNKIQCNV